MTNDPPWHPTRFYRATPGGAPKLHDGYAWRGLVLAHTGWGEPRTTTRWTLIHLGCGGAIRWLTGSVAMVMPAAGEIALCSDWTLFDLPEGWRQTDPDLPAKVEAICEAHPEVRPERIAPDRILSDADARAVIEATEGLRQ